ncbi:MAG: DNA primase [Eubacterium sp.]|nr:DNA primase [Eubacterium sp.]
MTPSISNESIEHLKESVNIVDVISRSVDLKRAGANFKGLCPFHNEKTPSFVVSESKQFFTCFGCGARGDVIEFEKRYYNLGFSEAVEKLADEYGVTLEKKQGYEDKKRARYYEINKMAARYFYGNFTRGKNDGYDYMKNRGISDKTLKKFGIGYAPKGWTNLYDYLKKQGVSDQEMADLGLITMNGSKKYDRFRNRVMFPIINTSGKVIGFGGRAIAEGDSPKYLNSPESIVFKKKNNLYSLNFARQAAAKDGFIILVEGYMDVISLFQSGVENAVASLGTALTENQAKMLHRYTGDVVLSYDADAAGRKAAMRGMDILRDEDCRVRVLHVTDGKDPDEYVKKYGKDAFLELVGGAKTFAEYKLDSARQGFDLSKDDDKVRYIRKAAAVLASLDPVEQDLYSARISEELGVSRDSIMKEVQKEGARSARETAREPSAERAEEADDLTMREAYLIRIVSLDPEYIDKILENKSMLTSGLAKRVLNRAYTQNKKTGKIDLDEIIDGLTEADQKELIQTLQSVVIDEKQVEAVYKDLVDNWKIEELSGKEKEILTSLSLADDSLSGEKVKEFQKELIDVQMEIRKLRNRTAR